MDLLKLIGAAFAVAVIAVAVGVLTVPEVEHGMHVALVTSVDGVTSFVGWLQDHVSIS